MVGAKCTHDTYMSSMFYSYGASTMQDNCYTCIVHALHYSYSCGYGMMQCINIIISCRPCRFDQVYVRILVLYLIRKDL